MSELRVLITCPQLQRTFEEHRWRFQERGLEVELPPVVQQLNEDEMAAIIGRFDGAIVGDDVVSRTVLESATRLRIVSKWGVGVDNIDMAAAAARGIRVTNTPWVFGDEVADVVIGYLVLLARGLHLVDRGVRDGTWPKLEGVSLAGRCLGIVGLGSIGRSVARRALAMDMRVVGYDVVEQQCEAARRLGVEPVSLDELLRAADVVSLNCPLTSQNRHMLDEPRLSLMRQGAWIVNTARGPLIDEAALVDALASRHIAAAALDVFEVEPLPAQSPFRHLDNVILGAHNASNTAEAVRRVSEMAIGNLLHGLDEEVR